MVYATGAIVATMVIGSFLSGDLLTSCGWDSVLWLSFFPLAVAVAALALSALYRQRGELVVEEAG